MYPTVHCPFRYGSGCIAVISICKRNGAGTSPIHSTVTSAGGAANTGACVSSMVISCVAVAVFPHRSVNVQVLVITAGHVPDRCTVCSRYGSGCIAVISICKRNGAGTSPIHSTVTSAGSVANTGASVSSMVINLCCCRRIAARSVNVHVLVITAGQDPTGALSVAVTVPAASQLSVYASA